MIFIYSKDLISLVIRNTRKARRILIDLNAERFDPPIDNYTKLIATTPASKRFIISEKKDIP